MGSFMRYSRPRFRLSAPCGFDYGHKCPPLRMTAGGVFRAGGGGRSKPLPYGEWDSIVMSIEGIGGIKHLPRFMGTLGKVLCPAFFQESGGLKNGGEWYIIKQRRDCFKEKRV